MILDALAQRDEEIRSNIVKDPTASRFICMICQFGGSSRHKVFCHIESKHFQDPSITYTCPYCLKSLASRSALGSHVSRSHRGETKNSIFPKDSSFNWINLVTLHFFGVIYCLVYVEIYGKIKTVYLFHTTFTNCSHKTALFRSGVNDCVQDVQEYWWRLAM